MFINRSPEECRLYSDLLDAARKVCEVNAREREKVGCDGAGDSGGGGGDVRGGGGDSIDSLCGVIAKLGRCCAAIDERKAESAKKCRELEERRSRLCGWCKNRWSKPLDAYPYPQGEEGPKQVGFTLCPHSSMGMGIDIGIACELDAGEMARMRVCAPCSLERGVCMRCGAAGTDGSGPKVLPSTWEGCKVVAAELLHWEFGYAIVRTSLTPDVIEGGGTLYIWGQHRDAFAKCLRCWCPERSERMAGRDGPSKEPWEKRKPKCSSGEDYAGRRLELRFDRGEWKGVKRPKDERCKVSRAC